MDVTVHDEDLRTTEDGKEFYLSVHVLAPYALRVSIRRPQDRAPSADVDVWTDLSGWQAVWSDQRPREGTLAAVVERLIRRAADVLQVPVR